MTFTYRGLIFSVFWNLNYFFPGYFVKGFTKYPSKMFFFDSASFFKTFYFKDSATLYFLRNFTNVSNLPIFINYNLRWFRIVLFSGLGYKRKLHRAENLIFSYVADRHWIIYKLSKSSTILPIKRRNFLFLSLSRFDINSSFSFFSTIHKPYVYKVKGFLDYRIKRRFIFVRRLRLRGVKAKLSKKQLML